jgi:hypothetical protein
MLLASRLSNFLYSKTLPGNPKTVEIYASAALTRNGDLDLIMHEKADVRVYSRHQSVPRDTNRVAKVSNWLKSPVDVSTYATFRQSSSRDENLDENHVVTFPTIFS